MTNSEEMVSIDFTKAGGMVAGIVQDAKSNEVLMLGFLNEESYRRTIETIWRPADWVSNSAMAD